MMLGQGSANTIIIMKINKIRRNTRQLINPENAEMFDIIQVAFMAKDHRIVERSWEAEMGEEVPGAMAVAYFFILFTPECPECWTSKRLYSTPRGAAQAADAGKWVWYATYDDAISALADSVGCDIE